MTIDFRERVENRLREAIRASEERLEVIYKDEASFFFQNLVRAFDEWLLPLYDGFYDKEDIRLIIKLNPIVDGSIPKEYNVEIVGNGFMTPIDSAEFLSEKINFSNPIFHLKLDNGNFYQPYQTSFLLYLKKLLIEEFKCKKFYDIEADHRTELKLPITWFS